MIDLQRLEFDRDFLLIKSYLQFVQRNTNLNPGEPELTEFYRNNDCAIRSIDGDLRGADCGNTFLRLKYRGGKTSFLVFKNQKYTTVQTECIAFFYIRNDTVFMMCFDKQEYSLNQSLDQITNSVSPDHFFRVNRKYLINFKAIKEVEHYFQRKLFVKLLIDTPDKLLINKEKTQSFLSWMEDR